MAKIPVSNIAAVGIIVRASNPTQIFIEMKDDGHPIKLVRRQLCLIGGNWIGEAAKRDINPLATFRRELFEELSFERPIRNSVELALLGQADIEQFTPVPDLEAKVLPADQEALEQLKKMIADSAVHFGDYLNTVSKTALDSADPENKRAGFTVLVSYYLVALSEDMWQTLVYLQEKFKNLSNESMTLITSLEEIVRTDTKTSFGHDRVLQEFFLKRALDPVLTLAFPLVSDVNSIMVSQAYDTYTDYLDRYEVVKKPV